MVTEIKKTPTAIEVKQSKEIIPQETQLVNFDPERQVEQATIAAKALMSVVSRKPKKVEFNGEQYLEFEDWQTIAQFYNHTVGIEWTKPIEEAGKIIGFEAKANLYHNGVLVGGAEAACMTDEGNWAKKPKFQLRSMAQTRAMAKALRSRFGFVAVLAGFRATPAEEMDGVSQTKSQSPEAQFYCSVHDNSMILRPAGTTKQGTPYKAFWACTKKDNGSFCKGPFLNTDGQVVKQNPETGEMQVVEVHEAEIVDESSVDKARRILGEKIPKNNGKQVKFNK